MKNYWKYIIISLLAGVAVFHISAMAMIWGENYELTSADYYERESTFEAEMAALRAGAPFRWNCDVTADGVVLRVLDAADQTPAFTHLNIELYKPDNASADRTLHPQQNEGGAWQAQAQLVSGMWRYRINAKLDGKDVAYRSSVDVP